MRMINNRETISHMVCHVVVRFLEPTWMYLLQIGVSLSPQEQVCPVSMLQWLQRVRQNKFPHRGKWGGCCCLKSTNRRTKKTWRASRVAEKHHHELYVCLILCICISISACCCHTKALPRQIISSIRCTLDARWSHRLSSKLEFLLSVVMYFRSAQQYNVLLLGEMPMQSSTDEAFAFLCAMWNLVVQKSCTPGECL